MNHPFNKVPAKVRPLIFVLAFISTISLMIALNVLGSSLLSDAAPNGIISYELARDQEAVQIIFDSWADNEVDNAKVVAAFTIGLDYLFIPLYSTTIALAIVWMTQSITKEPKILYLAFLLAWGQWLAAILDTVENGALYKMLIDGASTSAALLSSTCAIAKFSLVIAGILYVVVVTLVWLLRRLF